MASPDSPFIILNALQSDIFLVKLESYLYKLVFCSLSSVLFTNVFFKNFMQEEFEAEKKAALHNKDDVLVQEAEEAWALCRKEIEALSVQLQEKTNKIIQVNLKMFRFRF